MHQLTSSKNVAALDVGNKRIGVAITSLSSKLPRPFTTLVNDSTIMHQIKQLVGDQSLAMIIIGRPRGLDGQETNQTRTTQEFVIDLQKHVSVPIYWQDETLTSRKAEEELFERKKPFSKAAVDALAATYILEDFLKDHPELLDE